MESSHNLCSEYVPWSSGLFDRNNCGAIRRPNHGRSGQWAQRGSDDALDARGVRHASLWSNYLRMEYRCSGDVLSNSRYWRKLRGREDRGRKGWEV